MTVRFTEAIPTTRNGRTEIEYRTYTATNRDACRGMTDRSVYDMVVMLGQTVRTGAVTGEPA